ncbi:hypothetical protein ACJX0J_042376, partial [Zea mays]
MKYKLYVNVKGGTKLSLGALISVCYAHQNNMWKHILLLFDGVILEALVAGVILEALGDCELRKRKKIHFGMNFSILQARMMIMTEQPYYMLFHLSFLNFLLFYMLFFLFQDASHSYSFYVVHQMNIFLYNYF